MLHFDTGVRKLCNGAMHRDKLKGQQMRLASLAPMRQFLLGSLVIVAYFIATALATKAAAEIKIERYDGGINITITGEITDRDAKQFQEIASELEHAGLVSVLLDSTGGGVSAAINIGRLIRKYDGWTTITGKCYSSCALIFIAGVKRFNYGGELGIHRPYLWSAPQSRETLEKAVPLILLELKSYIADMGVTDNFYQQMVNTEPAQMVIYYHDDYTALVPDIDPVYDEIVVANEARAHGLTTYEMRRRDKDAQEHCRVVDVDHPPIPTYFPPGVANPFIGPPQFVCSSAIEWGLSERVYLERNAKSKRECWFDDMHRFGQAEQATIDKTPSKLVQDLPLYIRWETCVRSVMLGKPVQRSWFSWLFGR